MKEEIKLQQTTEQIPAEMPDNVELEQTNEQMPGEIPEMTDYADVSDVYSYEEFYEVFKSVFAWGGDVFKIQSLPISASEEMGARATSNKVYEWAEKYKFFHFCIEKNNGKLAESILVISFIISKINKIAEEKKVNIWGKLWQKIKFLKPKMASASDYSAPVGAEKQPKPANS